MQALCVDENGQFVKKDIGGMSGEFSTKHPLIAAAERIEDECKGWMGYKSLAKEQTSGELADRYEKASLQEFSHMIIALDDFFSTMLKHKMLTEREKEEMKRLIHVMSENYK